MDDHNDSPRSLDDEYPIIRHTRAGRLFSTIRRMKVERELAIPMQQRTAFVFSAATGKPANELNEREWRELYIALCGELRRHFPELYERLFR